MLAVAGGIILAFFILGLLSEVPDWFWYWFWGGVIVFIIWWFDFLPDILSGLVVCVVLILFFAGWNWLGKKIDCWKNSHKNRK